MLVSYPRFTNSTFWVKTVNTFTLHWRVILNETKPEYFKFVLVHLTFSL